MSEHGAMALRHPEAASLHAMWTGLCGHRPAPFRRELDAEQIGSKAPYLAIFEHVGPSNFRVRIAGDRLNRWFGLELRGMSVLAMVEGQARNHVQAALNRVVADPAVGIVRGRARATDGRALSFEMVLLPMRSDFGRIDRVLCGLWLLDPPGALACPILLDADDVRVCPVSDEDGDAVTLIESAPGEDAAPQIAPAAQPASGRPVITRGHLRLVKS